MPAEVITSRANPLVRKVRRLRQGQGREPGLLLLDSPHLVEEALVAGIPLPVILFTPAFSMRPAGRELLERCRQAAESGGLAQELRAVSPEIMRELVTTETPAGVVAVARWDQDEAGRERFWSTVKEHSADEPPFLVVADAIQDPGNLGTIFRTAAAAGAQGVVVTPGTVAPTNLKVLRASAGALFRLPWVKLRPEELESALQRLDIPLYVAESHGELVYDEVDWTGPVAVAAGNEGQGPSEALRRMARATVAIPLANQVESLNAAVAAAILMYEVVRQRRQRGQLPR
ncbi:MAG: RNA methyltransferase [Limnochordales bacterium]|nr:RNA methyltransferase [Limnochordales bacterium]